MGLSYLPRNITWWSGSVPLEWQTWVVVKRGDHGVCSNYRGSHFSASLERSTSGCLERRIQLIVKLQIQEYQCGFCPCWGTLDQLYTLHRVVDGSLEFVQPHILLIWKKQSTMSLEASCRGWCYTSMLRAARSPYDQSNNLDRIAGSKSISDLPSLGWWGVPLQPIQLCGLW